jgi:outer membrane lipopolysaccharide assembly protein LptE/RlpB
MNRILSVVFLMMNGFFLTACGYTFRGTATVLPADVKNIYIPQVQNSSTDLGLGPLLTEALREEFDSYGAVSVVENQREADAILKVKILGVKRSTNTVQANTNTALQMDTTMQVGGELRRTTGAILWRESSLQVSKDYGSDKSVVVATSPDFASGSISSSDLSNLSNREISRGQEKAALNNLAQDAARMIYDKSVAADF